VKRSLLAVLLPTLPAAILSVLPLSPAAAWHAETYRPPAPLTYLDNLSVTVGRKAWVLTSRTRNADAIEYSSWYLDVGDDGPGQHVSAPGEVQLFTLPTADQSQIGGLACDRVRAAPLAGRSGEKIRVAQSCLGSPDRLRVRLSVSAGESSYSWSPGPGRSVFHPFVDNVARPVA
jgi:hypothetical protein